MNPIIFGTLQMFIQSLGPVFFVIAPLALFRALIL